MKVPSKRPLGLADHALGKLKIGLKELVNDSAALSRTRPLRFDRSFVSTVLNAAVVAIVGVLAWEFGGRLLPEERVAGRAHVADGDSLEIDGRRMRLEGLDAPELAQVCRRADAPYPCGRASRQRLVDLIGQGPLECTGRSRDRYDRLLVRCRVPAGDVGAILVREGWAVGYGGYRREEAEARAARRGLWNGSFDAPDLWRRQHQRGES
jgi:endonuclease YncB( thermonuclease family)